MRIFASERVSGLMQKLGMEEGEAIEHPWVTKAIENAQRKVEAHNFDIRKQLLEYDDVANDQRKVVYEQRNELLGAEEIAEAVASMREDVVAELINQHIPAQSMEEQWDLDGLGEALKRDFGVEAEIRAWLEQDSSLHEEPLRQRILETVLAPYKQREALVGSPVMRQLEKGLMLQVLDAHWKEHLAGMDYLRQGIHLRGYAQKNPKQEFKREAFEMFRLMLERIKHEVIGVLTKIEFKTEAPPQEAIPQPQQSEPTQLDFRHDEISALDESPSEEPLAVAGGGSSAALRHQPFVRQGRKIGRNEPCPCGSGKKYKQCHGKLN